MENEIEAKDVAEQVSSSHREQRLVLGSSGVQEPEQEKCGTTHYAGCACHEKGWDNKWKAAIELAARVTVERDEARRMWSIYQDKCAELSGKYATHHAEADRLTLEITATKCTLAKWIEWARMHGHLDHAAGIAATTREILSENVTTHTPGANEKPLK